ncbi:hypothetical protein E3P99_03570 [Wallemia hederae]|uniref:CHY-type domain-containing protein n=1 Tax=Wallemia hederae TaxID=1540922 RepID=A0A4V4LSK1_9BASI|nr:hypothetical protein E3P99_03570 [Wallemia hederae]
MCKHVLNAQAAIRSPCCRKWFDCPECHEEKEDHPLAKALELAFMCKKCKRAFRKDMAVFEESDEYCPHCDNHFVIDAKTPEAALMVEGEDARVDNRMIKDERSKIDPERTINARNAELSDRMG